MTTPAPSRRSSSPFTDTETFHTIAEVAERLKVSPRSVSRLIERGELEVHRIGKNAVRISEGALQRYLATVRR